MGWRGWKGKTRGLLCGMRMGWDVLTLFVVCRKKIVPVT